MRYLVTYPFVWDDDKGLYHIIPNVAFDRNEEVKGLDPLTYQELKGTKDMIVERLAVVLANAMRLERNFNLALKTIGKGAENE